jgi:hypothetical protein
MSGDIRMAVAMAVTAAFYPPAVPVFLLTRGRDSTVLKGTEVTAYTKYTKRDASVETEDLPFAKQSASELAEMIRFLPPRVLNGEGREGDMLNLISMAKEVDLQALLHWPDRAGLWHTSRYIVCKTHHA